MRANTMHNTLASIALAGCALLAGSAASLAQPAPPPAAVPSARCADNDRACAQAAQTRHPVRQVGFWQAQAARPLLERIASAPAPLVEYLTLDNIANGYPERPRATQPDAAFLADLRAALAGLPPRVLQLLDDKLLGLYLVDGLGGTGYTDVALDAHGQAVAGFVVLDAAVLARRRANDWATWKENTPFKPQPGHQLQAQIEEPRHDNRTQAIQYILLHELGHVLAIGAGFHPPWHQPLKDLPLSARHPFYDLSWQMDRDTGRHASLFDGRFEQRGRVAYYFGARLDATDMLPVYSRLAETNFVSLYAATNPYDDFAESFASYVHTVLLGKPWRVTVLRGGQPVLRFGSCWEQARCAGKRAMLARVLGGD